MGVMGIMGVMGVMSVGDGDRWGWGQVGDGDRWGMGTGDFGGENWVGGLSWEFFGPVVSGLWIHLVFPTGLCRLRRLMGGHLFLFS